MISRTPRPPRQVIAGPLLEVGSLWLMIVLTGVLLVAGLLDHWRQQELHSVEHAQLELTLLEIQDELEGNLSLGMDLQHDLRIQGLLDSHLEKDPQLYSLDVLDAQGRALFSTDRASVGEPLPPAAWAAALQGAAQQRSWHALIAATPVMGVDLRGPFGETAGHVSVSYASRAAAPFAEQVLTMPLLLVLCATALAGSGAVWLATRPQRQRLQAQSHGRLAQVHAQLAATRLRLDDAALRLDAVEHIE